MRYTKFLGAVTLTLALGAGCGSAQNGEQHQTKTTTGTANFSAMAQPQISGAVFTTNSSGEQVNGNIYAAKTDVYLNGGPAKLGAAGLPDGDYYFIVTDPGCKEALNDPLTNEIITVENGEFTSLVQLAPFDTTSNNGGEYKVHVTPVSEYDPTAKNSCFGFVPAYTKTDNFKVRVPGNCITGTKFFDHDYLGGVMNPGDGDTGIAGFMINLTSGSSTISTFTGTNGDYAFCGLEDGTYTVSESLPINPPNVTWVQTFPAAPGTYTVTLAGADITGLDFGNTCRYGSYNYWATSVEQCGDINYPGAAPTR